MCFRLFCPITESSGSSLTMQHVDIKTESSNTKTNTKEQEYVLYFFVIPCTSLIVEGFIRVQREWTVSLRHACFPLEILWLQVFQYGLVPVFHSCLIYQVLCFSPCPWLACPLERSSDFLLSICLLCIPQLSYLSGSLLSSLQIGWRSYEGHQQYAEWFLFWAGFHVRLSINLYFINNMMKRIVKIS